MTEPGPAPRLVLVLLPFVLAACERRKPVAAQREDHARREATWPELPSTLEGAKALLARRARRPAVRATPLATDELIRRVGDGDRLVVGSGPIRSWLQRRVDRSRKARRELFLLWGTYHDAGGQIAAFTRLIGPGGLAGLTRVLVEQFDADGAWSGVDRSLQRGDDRLLQRFARTGSRTAFRALQRRQRRLNYTAWKYRYLPLVMDLVVTARAAGLPLEGCDMPRPLQGRLPPGLEQDIDRLRELHCLLALRRRLGGPASPQRVAVIWGQRHVEPDAFVRLLDPQTLVVSVAVFGHRPGARSTEAELAHMMLLTDPVLLADPACDGLRQRGCSERVVLLLPGARLGAGVDRSRDPLDRPIAPTGKSRLIWRSDRQGVLFIDGQRWKVGRKELSIEVDAGSKAFRFALSGRFVVGRLLLPERGLTAVDLEDGGRRLRQVFRAVRRGRAAAKAGRVADGPAGPPGPR